MDGPYYTPQSYRSRDSVGYLVRRARSLLTAHIEALFKQKLGHDGVSFIHWVILICLRDKIATTPTEICQYICHDSGALTRVLDQMEEGGLIKRRRSTQDRRVVEILLASRGEKTADALVPLVTEFYNEILVDFSREEADMLIRLLGKFVTSLDQAKGTA